MNTTYVFETQIERLARSARRRALRYAEHAQEPVSRFEAKSLYGKVQLCWTFQKGGA